MGSWRNGLGKRHSTQGHSPEYSSLQLEFSSEFLQPPSSPPSFQWWGQSLRYTITFPKSLIWTLLHEGIKPSIHEPSETFQIKTMKAKRLFKIYLITCLCECIPQMWTKRLDAGIRGICELSDVDTETQIKKSSGRAVTTEPTSWRQSICFFFSGLHTFYFFFLCSCFG